MYKRQAFLSAAALIGAGPETAAFAGQRKEAAVGENWQESGESQAVPYAGRNYEGIDLARLEQLLAQLEQACQGQEAMAADWRQAAVETAQGQEISGDPLSIYQQVLRELDWDATQMALADILYSRNMAVSYTHLDVYKRQGMGNTEGKRSIHTN